MTMHSTSTRDAVRLVWAGSGFGFLACSAAGLLLARSSLRHRIHRLLGRRSGRRRTWPVTSPPTARRCAG
jgi:hypothetical protein